MQKHWRIIGVYGKIISKKQEEFLEKMENTCVYVDNRRRKQNNRITVCLELQRGQVSYMKKEYKNIIKGEYRDRQKVTFQIILIETQE